MQLIDADELEIRKFTAAGSMSEYGRGWNDALAAVAENAPTIEAEPVRHGRWVKVNSIQGLKAFKCSECSSYIGRITAFCSTCGAKMDLKLPEETDGNPTNDFIKFINNRFNTVY